MYLLKTNSSCLEVEQYAQVVHLIHKHKALGLLAKDRTDEALREIELARLARPGDVGLVERVLPQLVKAGRRQAAEKLISDVARAYEEVLDSFPNSARHHNDLAWLLACCDRRLDDALAHATRAVELKPDSSGYLDTLAEVHFRRGERARAIDLAKHNLEGEPKNQHFQVQLRRFEEQSPNQHAPPMTRTVPARSSTTLFSTITSRIASVKPWPSRRCVHRRCDRRANGISRFRRAIRHRAEVAHVKHSAFSAK